jgi:hypothetical protein
MKVHVVKHGEWAVWVSLDETATEGIEDVSESFIVGVGETYAEAISHAERELQAAADTLRTLREQ